MAAGKSTYGKAVARKLGRPFIDLDAVIEQQEGKTVPEIFSQWGEPRFREIERQALLQVLAPDQPVPLIACGGGTPCYQDNMRWLNEHGITVYLKQDPEILLGRLKQVQASRPMISDIPQEELGHRIRELLAEREPYYLQAQIILEGSDITVDKIVEMVEPEGKI